MTSVGDVLRSARESQSRTMAEIAEDLCITQRYLRALENDDLKVFPGTFFYKSFVKQYAAALGVPEQQIQPGIETLTASEQELPLPGQAPAPGPIRTPDPLVEASNRYFSDPRVGMPAAALVVVLLACTGFYAWWNRAPQLKARTPQVVAQPAPVPIQEAKQTTPAVEVTATAAADDPNHVVLNLSATERTWLSITSEGKVIFSGILQPSQTKTLTASEAAQMKVGNAGGIEVRWNGKEIGPLGARGQVRTILFTSDNFQIVEPPPPPPGAEL